jgi:hypothetical protein
MNIPFDAETLKKIITGEIETPTVDYNKCSITGKNFITYFSNLKYKNVFINFDDVDVSEKYVLLQEYIKHQSMVRIEQLEATLVKSIFKCKGYDLSLVDKSEYDKEFLYKSILTNAEIEQFVSDNESLMVELCQILDGVLLYAIKNVNAFKESFGDSNITDNIVSEKLSVGKTFVSLFNNETFNCHYFASIAQFDKLKYFEHYYDRPIYSGQTLMTHISKDCVIFPLIKMVLECQFTPEEIIQIQREADAALI